MSLTVLICLYCPCNRDQCFQLYLNNHTQTALGKIACAYHNLYIPTSILDRSIADCKVSFPNCLFAFLEMQLKFFNIVTA